MDMTVTVEVTTMAQKERELLTTALRAWAERNHVNPADFAGKTGYSYNHAYQVLRGKLQASSETIGKVLLTYGVDAAIEIWNLMDGRPALELSNPYVSPED